MPSVINRWTPDTCPSPACSVDYSWDPTVPIASRVHSFVDVVSQCPAHATINGSAVFTAIQTENTNKNNAVSVVVSSFAAAFPTAASVPWSFGVAPNAINAIRPLIITASTVLSTLGPTAVTTTAIQAAITTALGTGVATVQ
jgi:hypothetical protein